MRNWTLIAVLVLAGLGLVMPAPGGLPVDAWRAAIFAAAMAALWMSEALPLPVTALIPIVAFPMAGVASTEDVAQHYAHPLILLFLGGFMLAAAIKRWRLDHRLALLALRLAGPRPAMQLLAVMAVTAFLSLWISNTATAMVMMPIGLSILSAGRLQGVTAAGREGSGEGQSDEAGDSSQFGSALMLGIAFAATIGGMGSLIGTPPNALFAAFMAKTYGITVGFGQWMLLGLPIVLVLLPITWLMLSRVTFRMPSSRGGSEAAGHAALPPLSRGQRIVAVVLALTALAWFLRPLLAHRVGLEGLSDAGIAIAGALILLALPARLADDRALLGWDDVKSIRWDVLLLFGGGLALADAIQTTGLADWIGSGTGRLSGVPVVVLVLLMMAVTVYLGELASNTAMAAVLLPVAGAAAAGLGVPALELVLPVALAASLGFMLPVATPPNAIVYGSGAVSSREMLRAGALLDVISILVVFGFAVTLGTLVFGG